MWWLTTLISELIVALLKNEESNLLVSFRSLGFVEGFEFKIMPEVNKTKHKKYNSLFFIDYPLS